MEKEKQLAILFQIESKSNRKRFGGICAIMCTIALISVVFLTWIPRNPDLSISTEGFIALLSVSIFGVIALGTFVLAASDDSISIAKKLFNTNELTWEKFYEERSKENPWGNPRMPGMLRNGTAEI